MLRKACCINGVSVYVYKKKDCIDVMEDFIVDGLFFVMFSNGKCVVERMVGGKSLVIDGSEFELVKVE